MNTSSPISSAANEVSRSLSFDNELGCLWISVTARSHIWRRRCGWNIYLTWSRPFFLASIAHHNYISPCPYVWVYTIERTHARASVGKFSLKFSWYSQTFRWPMFLFLWKYISFIPAITAGCNHRRLTYCQPTPQTKYWSQPVVTSCDCAQSNQFNQL